MGVYSTSRTPQAYSASRTPQGYSTSRTPQRYSTSRTQGYSTNRNPPGYSISRTPQRGMIVLIIMELLILPSVVLAEFLGDPECTLSMCEGEDPEYATDSNCIYCYPKAGRAMPQFLSNSNESYISLMIRGNRNFTQLTGKWINISMLEISGTGISELSCEIFAGLEHRLIELDLKDNFLTNVPTCAIGRLIKLYSLILDSNNITTLRQSAFTSLLSLHELSLKFNKIGAIELGALGGLVQLQELYLTGNLIQNLGENIFLELKGLNKLVLRANKLTTLTKDAFAGLGKVRDMDLSDNQLKDMDGYVFVRTSSISYLLLTNNSITKLSSGIFKGLDELDYLSLQDNHLTGLGKGLFGNNSALRILKAENNKITKLPVGIFRDLINVEHIYLENNSLSELSEGTFESNSRLKELHLQENQISKIGLGAFSGLTELDRLYLGNNHLDYLSKGVFFGCPNVHLIELQNNRITSLHPESFDGLHELQSLSIAGNKLKEIPGYIFKLAPKLMFLDIQDNNISLLHKTSFVPLSGLRFVRIYNNSLTEVMSSLFESCPELENIDLSTNQIIKVGEDAFKGLETSLTALDLSNNFISKNNTPSLLKSLLNLKSLVTLALSNNQLETLSEDFLQQQSRLSSLRLRNCSLRYLPRDYFKTRTALDNLDISANELTGLDGLNISCHAGSANISNNRLGEFHIDYQQGSCFSNLYAQNSGLQSLTLNTPNGLDINLNLTNNSISNPIVVTYTDKKANLGMVLDLSFNGIRKLSGFPVKFGKKVADKIAFLDRCTRDGAVWFLVSTLVLRQNNISHVSPSACLGSVFFLDLSDNELETIGSLVLNTKCLRLSSLNLARNRIDTIPPNAFDKENGKTLWRLDLRSNRLTGFLHLEVLLSRDRFVNLKMAENLIDCSCNVFWLRNASVAWKLDDVRCHTPERLRGYLVVCVPLEDCSLASDEQLEISEATRELCRQDTNAVTTVGLLTQRTQQSATPKPFPPESPTWIAVLKNLFWDLFDNVRESSYYFNSQTVTVVLVYVVSIGISGIITSIVCVISRRWWCLIGYFFTIYQLYLFFKMVLINIYDCIVLMLQFRSAKKR